MKRRIHFAFVLLIGSVAAAGEPSGVLPVDAREAASQIAPGNLMGVIRFLADDLLEGRAPASRGDRLARAYIASMMELLGLAPAASGGGWEQPVELVGITAEVPETWRFRAGAAELDLRVRDEFIAASGEQKPVVALDGAELVFVGYGIQAPEFGWDDFKGADLKGKLLLMLNNDPDWDPALFAGTRRLYYGRWTYKYESAARQGAAGAIIIHTTPSAGYPWQVVQSSWSGEQFELPAGNEPRVRVKGWLTEAATRRLVSLAGFQLDELVARARDRAFRPVPLGVRTSLSIDCAIRQAQTANMIGRLEGSDPGLREQVVIYSAHHDHLGKGKPDKTGDDIYNGALDNASGVAQILAVAGAFRHLKQPPRRSILFLAFAGEEQGLVGSAYFATYPTVPPGQIAADINIDSGNILGRTRDVVLVGKGKSTLDDTAAAAAALQARVVTEEQFPDRGAFYRSDQFSLARIGVPALYMSSGVDVIGKPPGWGRQKLEEWVATHYHQPSDQLDASWNLDGMVEDAQLAFYAGLMVAQADAMPAWVPGDEFELARKQALAAAAAHAASR